MTTISKLVQRPNECSLTALSAFNGLSQADYEAFSDLVRAPLRGKKRGFSFVRGGWALHDAIFHGVEVAKELGLNVPAGYPGVNPGVNGWLDKSPPVPDLSGKGLVRVAFKFKRRRNWSQHILPFEDGKLYETDGKVYDSWASYAEGYKKNGSRDLRVVKIFR